MNKFTAWINSKGLSSVLILAVVLLVLFPLAFDIFRLNLVGKYLTYAFVALGLVYVCDVLPMDDERFRISIKMTVTAPGCGMGEGIAQEVQDKLEALPRVGQVEVVIVFDPPWDRSMMSEDAQLELGL